MWQLLVAATYVISAFNVAAKFYLPGDFPRILVWRLHGLCIRSLSLAAWLLKGAPTIADFFYALSRSEEKTPDDKPSDPTTPTI